MTPRTLATALALLLAGTAASTTVSAHERVPSGQQVGTSPGAEGRDRPPQPDHRSLACGDPVTGQWRQGL